VPIVVPVQTAVEKVLANNVPVLAGTPVISPILFNADSAKLDKVDLTQIKAASAILKEKSGWVYITGFVKSAGRPASVEKKIATDRAKAVATLLSKLGLKVKIGFLGYGHHNTKSPSAKDRKVEVRWVPEKSQNS
jgi:outer membrane protein OmpA-like peptidoglycan-associated protein